MVECLQDYMSVCAIMCNVVHYHCMCACRTSKKKLGCNAQLIVDEFGEKLLEELDYLQEARNIQVTAPSMRITEHDIQVTACNYR